MVIIINCSKNDEKKKKPSRGQRFCPRGTKKFCPCGIHAYRTVECSFEQKRKRQAIIMAQVVRLGNLFVGVVFVCVCVYCRICVIVCLFAGVVVRARKSKKKKKGKKS